MVFLKLILNYFNVGDPEWSVRRRMAVVMMLFCFGVIVYAMVWVPDTSRANNAINQAFIILGLLVSVYIGAATVDDHMKRKLSAQLGAGSGGFGGGGP